MKSIKGIFIGYDPNHDDYNKYTIGKIYIFVILDHIINGEKHFYVIDDNGRADLFSIKSFDKYFETINDRRKRLINDIS